MKMVILFTCLSVFCIILALFDNIISKHKSQKKRLKNLIKNQQDIVDEKLNIPFTQRFLKPMFSSFMTVLGNIKPKKADKSASTKKLARDLMLAGIKMSSEEYGAIKTMIAVGIPGLIFIVTLLIRMDFKTKILCIFGGFVLGFLIPNYYLKARIKSRQSSIKMQMPDTMDLLSVSIEAGLSFDGALSRLAQQTKNELTEEFSIMLKEIQMGRSRRDALKDLGLRNDIPELRVFSSSMIQAEQYGISIKNVLKSQASQLRTERKNRAEEKAMKAPVKMMLPIIAFIFPVVFIILLAPAAFDIMKSFGG